MLSRVLTALQTRSPGNPATKYQKRGATTPSAKFSAQLSIAAPADPMTVELTGVAADDVPHHAAPLLEPIAAQGCGDVLHLVMEISLGQQDGDDNRLYDPAQGGKQDTCYRGENHDRHKHGEARNPSPGGTAMIDMSVETVDEGSEDHDRMLQPSPQPARVTDQPVEDDSHCESCRKCVVEDHEDLRRDMARPNHNPTGKG